MKIRSIASATFLMVIVTLFSGPALFAQESLVLRAIEDELQRTVKSLKLGKEKPPYYVAYRVDDEERTNLSARFGALVDDDLRRERKLYIDLRIGDYEFDNSNFVPMAGYGFRLGLRESFTSLPLDDDYDAIRQKIWLATDERYKEAIDNLSKKKSTIEHRAITEKIPDFSKSTPYVMIEPPKKVRLDREAWQRKIKEISNLFRQFPKIQSSNVIFTVKSLTRYFVDSEGSKQVTNYSIAGIEVYANTQTKDGANLRNLVSFYAPTPEELPPLEAIVSRVKAMAETLSIYTELKGENEYSGPVLFDGLSSCQLFYQILGKGVSDVAKPLYEQERIGEIYEEKTGFLSGRLDKPVLPDYLSVEDDPTLTTFAGRPLIGGYRVDDQGVKAERIELVKNGKLVNLPMSRKPTKELKKSNGHGRFFMGMVRNFVSNLIVRSEKTTEDLEKGLIALCKENGLEYGIVIKELMPSLPKTNEEMVEEIYSYFGGGKLETPLLDAPFIAYKLYTNGKKELIKGLKFEGVTPSVLREIVAVGVGTNGYNTLVKEKFGDGYLPISVVAPPVIIGKMVLTAKEEKTRKQPYLPHPYFGKR